MNVAVPGWDERRRFARIAPPRWSGGVSLSRRGSRGSAAPVLDLSPGGVALAPGSAAWLSEDTPLSLRVGAHEISCSLAPESSERLRWLKGSPERVGLGLSFDSEQADEVARLYHRLRFPSLHRRGAVPPSEVRDLLSESGYLALRPGIEPGDPWLRADWPSTLSHEAVFREHGGRAVGHIAISRAYANAWIGHEIAMMPRTVDNLRCRRDLYQHFCVWPRLIDGESAQVFGYYSPKRRFHQEMFETFASRSPTDECVVVRMERYMRDPSWSPERTGARLAGFSVEPMTADEESGVLAMLERSWPDLARAALDVGPGRLSQERLHPAFAVLGGRRARQCLILRSGQRLIAALLCEWEDTGLSLFDALSVAHVFLYPGVESNGPVEDAIACVLHDFYIARGARIPLFTCPPGTFQARDVPGFKWVETMGCMVFSARALRAFESHVELAVDLDVPPTGQGRPAIFGKDQEPVMVGPGGSGADHGHGTRKDSRHDA